MWYRGFVNPTWDETYKNLSFNRFPPTEEDLTTWRKLGYTHNNFTGMLYNDNSKMPNWVYNISKQIKLTNCGYTFYKMQTGDIMPMHIDHFTNYCRIFKQEKKNVWRAIVALEDWASGHYFEIENHAITNYKKGEYIIWSHDAVHSAANIGVKNRYTLQITGTLEFNG